MDQVIILKAGIDQVIDRINALPDTPSKLKILEARSKLEHDACPDLKSIVDDVVAFINERITHEYSNKACMICLDSLDSPLDTSRPYARPCKLKCGSCFVHHECMHHPSKVDAQAFSRNELFTCSCDLLHDHSLNKFVASVIFKDGRKLNLDISGLKNQYLNVIDRAMIVRHGCPSRYAVQMMAVLTTATERVWKAVKCECKNCQSKKNAMVFPIPSSDPAINGIPAAVIATVEEFLASIEDPYCMTCLIVQAIANKDIDFTMIGLALTVMKTSRRLSLSFARRPRQVTK